MMNDLSLIVWLELLRNKVGSGDTTPSLSIINELIDKLEEKMDRCPKSDD